MVAILRFSRLSRPCSRPPNHESQNATIILHVLVHTRLVCVLGAVSPIPICPTSNLNYKDRDDSKVSTKEGSRWWVRGRAIFANLGGGFIHVSSGKGGAMTVISVAPCHAASYPWVTLGWLISAMTIWVVVAYQRPPQSPKSALHRDVSFPLHQVVARRVPCRLVDIVWGVSLRA